MNARSLRAVLTHAAAQAADGAATDADLVARFAADKDAAAFAELVRRYGRLVWAVCRQTLSNEADAEDAFQATFLALVTSAGAVRKTATLAPWLHGVAYRVATKAKRSAARRHRREAIAASAEADAAVPGSAWDAALAAVHDAVAELPDHLRTPFVLCCLEGHGQTDAAARLGWKLGTLSGRLTRAKQAVLDHLAKRGLPVGAAVALTTAVGPPAAVAARALAVAAGDTIPRSISLLAHGVTGMSTLTRTKLLAAAVMVAGGLAAGWQATSVAQDAPPPGVRERQAAYDARKRAEQAEQSERQARDERTRVTESLNEVLLAQSAQARKKPAGPPQWEYDFSLLANAPGQRAGETAAEYRRVFHEREADGWEYVGTTPLDTDHGKGVPAMVFRRPNKAAMEWHLKKVEGDAAKLADKMLNEYRRAADADKADKRVADQYRNALLNARDAERAAKDADRKRAEDAKRAADPKPKSADAKPAGGPPAADPARSWRVSPDRDPEHIKSEIARLQALLAAAERKPERVTLVLPAGDLPTDPASMMSVIKTLAKASAKPVSLDMSHSPAGLTIEGDKAAIEWVRGVLAAASGKPGRRE